MEKHEWGMKIIEGPFVTLDEAKLRITIEHGCVDSWRKSSERKARELEECGEHIETLEAELRTLREDKARLDWLEHSAYVNREHRHRDAIYYEVSLLANQGGKSLMTFRAAIDARSSDGDDG